MTKAKAPRAALSARPSNRPRFRLWRRLGLLASGGVTLQFGCASFFQSEVEALLAPFSPDNASLVLNSVFFDLLVTLFV